jgi:hypothetical protein
MTLKLVNIKLHAVLEFVDASLGRLNRDFEHAQFYLSCVALPALAALALTAAQTGHPDTWSRLPAIVLAVGALLLVARAADTAGRLSRFLVAKYPNLRATSTFLLTTVVGVYAPKLALVLLLVWGALLLQAVGHEAIARSNLPEDERADSRAEA